MNNPKHFPKAAVWLNLQPHHAARLAVESLRQCGRDARSHVSDTVGRRGIRFSRTEDWVPGSSTGGTQLTQP
jgi:hypothetical protein